MRTPERAVTLTGGWSTVGTASSSESGSRLSSHESASESSGCAVTALPLVFFLLIALPLSLSVSTGLLEDFDFLGLSGAAA